MKNYTLTELHPLTIKWSGDRNILKGSTIENQQLKGLEEIGETARWILKNNIPEIKDGIGDAFVCIINVMEMKGKSFKSLTELKLIEEGEIFKYMLNSSPFELLINAINDECLDSLNALCINLNLDFTECCNLAYNEIKDRKGKMINGTFIKEADMLEWADILLMSYSEEKLWELYENHINKNK